MRKAVVALLALAALIGAMVCLVVVREPLPVAAGQVYVNSSNDRHIEILEVGQGRDVAQHFQATAQHLASHSDVDAGGIIERLEVHYDPADADTQVVAYREKVWTTTLQDVQPWDLGNRVRKRVEMHRIRLIPVSELESKYDRVRSTGEEFWTWGNFSRALASDVDEASTALSQWLGERLTHFYSDIRSLTSDRSEDGSGSS